jgi:hypothetical protein
MIRSSLEDEKEGDEREGLDREEQWWEGQAKQSEDEPDEGGRRGRSNVNESSSHQRG